MDNINNCEFYDNTNKKCKRTNKGCFGIKYCELYENKLKPKELISKEDVDDHERDEIIKRIYYVYDYEYDEKCSFYISYIELDELNNKSKRISPETEMAKRLKTVNPGDEFKINEFKFKLIRTEGKDIDDEIIIPVKPIPYPGTYIKCPIITEVENKLRNEYYKWLKYSGYKEFTEKGQLSTIGSYIYYINFVTYCEDKFSLSNSCSWLEIAINIKYYVEEYGEFGSKKDLGFRSHSTCINALKRYYDFLYNTQILNKLKNYI